MTASVLSASNSLGISAEVLEAFVHLITLTGKQTTSELVQKMETSHNGTWIESLIDEYDKKM